MWANSYRKGWATPLVETTGRCESLVVLFFELYRR
jgi:hypothetical protein